MDKNEGWDWSFRTFLRVKPPLHVEGDDLNSDPKDDEDGSRGENNGLLQFHTAQEQGQGGEAVRRLELEIPLTAEPGLIHNNTTGFVPFCFNEIFEPDASQDQVFNSVRDMIGDAFTGINCTILAYGQTGTGKLFIRCRLDIDIVIALCNMFCVTYF
jgi:hypothetical protein